MSLAAPLAISIPVLLRIPIVLVLAVLVAAQNGPTTWTASPFSPPSLGLAVRSPYLNAWQPQGNGPAPISNSWPRHWPADVPVLGWYASVTVDEQAYQVLGNSNLPNVTVANQTAVEFTPTTTTFVLIAGNMQINLTFLSPIEPTDLVRQSLPFSYFYMTATSLDGNPHTVRMYSDISGEFIAGDGTQIAQWTPDDSGEYVILKMQLQTQRAFTENRNFAQDATEYYSFKKISGTTTSWGITEDVLNRGAAANASLTLNNTADPTPRAVDDNWPVLGIMVDWGSITQTPEPAVWGIGIVRNPVVQYRLPDTTIQMRSPYYMSAFSDADSAAQFFLDDFARAQSAAEAFDTQLKTAGSAFSSNYADLLSLSARQVMGAMEITLPASTSGTWDFTDVKVFMKGMGGAGSDSDNPTPLQSVNTVDVLYAAFPGLMYLNPELGGYLLAPLLEYQDSSAYTQTYAARNIGTAYPNATADGINDAHDYQVEETANMLIMTLAYSQISGNGTFLSSHYTLLQKWASFLENNSLTPTNQKSTDASFMTDISNNNQTNTALKGIIGIAAMAKIAEIANVKDDQSHFNDVATSYIGQWASNAVAGDNTHVDFLYGDTNSNGLVYNIYADKLLQLGLVPDSVYQVLTAFYNNIASQTKYGLPLNNQDTSVATTNSMMFAASALTNNSTRDFMVGQLHQYVTANLNNTAFTVVYNPTNAIAEGGLVAGVNSPGIGSVFSLLALNSPIQGITLPTVGSTIPGSSNPGKKSKSNAGAIAGGVVAAIVVISAIGVAVFFWLRRRRETLRRQREYDAHEIMAAYNEGKPRHGFAPGTTFEPFRPGADATTGYSTSTGDPYSPNSDTTQTQTQTYSEATSATHSGMGLASVNARTGHVALRDNGYSRSHRRGESGSDIGPSASQVGSESVVSGSGVSGGAGNRQGRPSRDGTAPQQVILAKQSLLNEELRSEVDNLRRDLERIQQERVATLEEAPPSYQDPA
ncbi:hypothetical protein M0805_009237 [Coniferiporia weirii]|nr:hypothetical protein M0805_009237 [Coniferiporia weirii]